ncbi:hypothetical protein FRACYDRAFT_257920 [Fragilariopsis cylindrus CCMP1102]|uniref:Uncharacterized protein n=1 Tax=Fragilariopsis cylindrus CCMP1102 TaxID=635003 RepID=A0A1E7EIX7_9STRA|nr:hypothetical protein FRACYDRAFT_257920 [Fragilariopsis cylindrus CCMP1102]|eukprot:OEU05842.1 hypothetical protein FRACYDRAFT_257920 [Fragilariopsis cylindrus CCMP1102]
MSSTSMPEVVEISGCDDTLWNSIPYGAQRDLERFCRLATDENLAWNNGVKSWELNNLAEKEMALAKVKADKKAAIKEAAKVEAAAKLAKEVEAEADAEMADGMENDDDDDDAFQ